MNEANLTPSLTHAPRPLRALATSQEQCAAQLRATLAWSLNEMREIRILDGSAPRHAVVSTPEEAASTISTVAYGAGCYITVNPIRPTAAIVSKVGPTLVRAERGGSTTDADIDHRTNFVVDLDPVRPTNTSATLEQLGEARALAQSMIDSLLAEGWPRPTTVCSGNGVHLYFPVFLPTASDLPARALRALDRRFSSSTVKVDTTVGNASRIMRMPGTWTAKDNRTDLHRIATLEEVGEEIILAAESLEAVVAPVATPSPHATPQVRNTGSFDVDAWLAMHGVKHRGKEPWPGGGNGAFRWVIDTCAFNPEHNKGEAVITQQPNGALGYTCHHDSCSEYAWKDFRTVIETASHMTELDDAPLDRPAYPMEALPPLLQEVVRTQVQAISVDEAAVAIPLLTAMLSVIGNAVVVQPWATWNEPMVAWTMLIAPSGQMKSATVGFAERTLCRLEEAFPPPPPDGKRQRLMLNDPTTEALSNVASRNPRGLILFRDELAAFLHGIGQYKKQSASDEAFWLSAYEGKYHTVDRASKGETIIRRLLVSVLGGIQPQVLKDALRAQRRIESGFAARFWMVMPPRRLIEIRAVCDSQHRTLETVAARLHDCLQSFRGVPMANGDPMVLRMDTPAVQRLEAFIREHVAIAHGLSDMSVERACRLKSRGWAAKLAGLIALIRGYETVGPRPDGDPTMPDWASLTIKDADVESAIRLVEWQLGENRRVHQRLGFDDLGRELDYQDELAREALDPVEKTTTVRAYCRKHGVDAAEAERILKALVDAGRWGVRHPKPGPKGGRPVALYYPLGDACLR